MLHGCQNAAVQITQSYKYKQYQKISIRTLDLNRSHMQYCTQSCIMMMGEFDARKICSFVQDNCQQDTIDFIQVYFCVFKNSFMVLLTVGVILLFFTDLIILFLRLFYCTLPHQIYLYLNNSPFPSTSIQTTNTNPPSSLCLPSGLTAPHRLRDTQSPRQRIPCPLCRKSHPFLHNQNLGFSETLAGVTFLAFANGAPDVLTAIIAGNSDSADTALIPMGSIFGALLFSTAIILSKVIFNSKTPEGTVGIKMNKGETVKPIVFYIFATVFLILVSIFFGEMRWYFALAILLFYVVYAIMVMIDEKRKKTQIARAAIEGSLLLDQDTTEQHHVHLKGPEESGTKQEEEAKGDYHKFQHRVRAILDFVFEWSIPSDGHQTWNILKVGVQMMVSTFFLVFSQGYLNSTTQSGWPLIAIAQIVTVGLFLTLVAFCRGKSPSKKWIFELYRFLIIVAFISYICSVLINLLELIRVVTDINSVFIGMTLLAFGNSIGDYFSIVAFAKKGKGMTAIAGVYSGQLFNLLIGMGISMLMRTISKGAYSFVLFPKASSMVEGLDDAIVWMIIVAALFNLCVTLIVMQRKNFVLESTFGKYLIYFYFGFIATICTIAILADINSVYSCDLTL